MKSKQQRWQEEQVRRGLCRRCGSPRDGSSVVHCSDCLVKVGEERRRYLEGRGIRAKDFGLRES